MRGHRLTLAGFCEGVDSLRCLPPGMCRCARAEEPVFLHSFERSRDVLSLNVDGGRNSGLSWWPVLPTPGGQLLVEQVEHGSLLGGEGPQVSIDHRSPGQGLTR